MIKPEERCCENCGWSQYKLGMIMVMGNNDEPTVQELSPAEPCYYTFGA